MTMTLQQLMKEKGLSRYDLSKASGIPWETVADIYSGKLPLGQCGQETVEPMASVLGVSRAAFLALTVIPEAGKPNSQSYLETGLPGFLQRSIDEFVDGEKNQVTYMDCLWGELYGSINAAMWGRDISEEQAVYLRSKYLFDESREICDD